MAFTLHVPSYTAGLEAGRRLRVKRYANERTAATVYLYGTPSPYSDMVKYGGVELPNIETVWDKAAYPYVFIGEYEADGSIAMICTSKPLQYGTWTSSSGKVYTYPHMVVKAGEIEARSIHSLNNGVWTSGSKQTFDRTAETTDYTVGFNPVAFWTNTDIPNTDNNTTYLAASEPVYSQVGGNVALADGEGYVLYDGAVLPPLPEWDAMAYPYAVICRNIITGITELHCLDAPLRKSVSYGTIVYRPDSDLYPNFHVLKFALSDTGEWTANESNPMYVNNTAAWINANSHDVLWTNTDIMDENGEVFLPASDPIPLASAEPVAAVYGGVKLPVLPNLVYPYAFIFASSNVYCLRITDGAVVDGALYCTGFNSVVGFSCSDGETWTAQSDIGAIPSSSFDKAIWSNHDMCDREGNVVHNASALVPVYEQKE